MWSTYILLILLPTHILGQLSYQDNNPVVDLGYAKYTGSHNTTSRSATNTTILWNTKLTT